MTNIKSLDELEQELSESTVSEETVKEEIQVEEPLEVKEEPLEVKVSEEVLVATENTVSDKTETQKDAFEMPSNTEDHLAMILNYFGKKETDKEDNIRKSVDETLSKLNVDLNNIKITRTNNPIDTFNDLEQLFVKPTFDIISLQSGYRAAYKPLNNNDLISARKMNGTEYEQNLKLLKIMHAQIADTSIGHIKFEDWLSITSEADFNTHAYGLYCATFPKDTDYTVSCGNCRTDSKLKVNKHSLIEVPNEDTIRYVNEIITRNLDPMEFVKNSIVNIKDRLILNESKIIVELITPTLKGMLQSLTKTTNFKGIEPEIFGVMKNISSMYIPNLDSIRRGILDYYQLDIENDKLRVLLELSKDDRKQLEAAMEARIEKYSVNYKLPDFTCNHCGHRNENIYINVLELLFKNIVGVMD